MRSLSGFLLGMGLMALQAAPGIAQTTAVPPIPIAPAPVPIPTLAPVAQPSAPAPVAPMPLSPPVQVTPPAGLPPVGLPPVGLPPANQTPALSTPTGPPPPMPYTGQTQSLQVPPSGPAFPQGAPALGPPIAGPVGPPPPPSNPTNLWSPASWQQIPPDPPGFFAGFGLDILDPQVRNRMDRTVTLPNGVSTNVALPGVKLDWTAQPEFEVGYRLPEGLGAFAVDYRFIVSDGRTFSDGAYGGTDELKSRLNLNIFDFDYITNTYEPLPHLDVQGRLGARLGLSYYDTTLSGPLTDFHESNYYVGAGPHLDVDINRRIVLIPGLSVGGKIDGAILIGQDKTDFLASGVDSSGDFLKGTNNMKGTITSEMLAIEAGLCYKVPDLETLKFSTGYRYEQWWDMGRSNGTSTDLTTNGFYFRVEYGF